MSGVDCWNRTQRPSMEDFRSHRPSGVKNMCHMPDKPIGLAELRRQGGSSIWAGQWWGNIQINVHLWIGIVGAVKVTGREWMSDEEIKCGMKGRALGSNWCNEVQVTKHRTQASQAKTWKSAQGEEMVILNHVTHLLKSWSAEDLWTRLSRTVRVRVSYWAFVFSSSGLAHRALTARVSNSRPSDAGTPC